MKKILNFSTHKGHLDLFDDDWHKAEIFLSKEGFDGYELYPVGDYPFQSIKRGLITGLHLRFFVIIEPIWRNDMNRLLEIFGDIETVKHFYGGCDRDYITEYYRKQLDLAWSLECEYVVFHPVHYELDYIYDWTVPWSFEDTAIMSSEIINEASKNSQYRGWILFENLWWPGNFRLDSADEIDFLLDLVDYSKKGIVLDTGHVLNKNENLRSEKDAIKFLIQSVKQNVRNPELIKAVHLSFSQSGEYIRSSRNARNPLENVRSFAEKYTLAREHVGRIDQHNPFSDVAIKELFDFISPEYLVFEFEFKSLDEWHNKIKTQKLALGLY
ncbi:MAG: sugar phosphate isomerase/epimerase [Deltaproteobacteria bacterium]|nr:MAG: sugar phosphate isomerase/epimerase [Deltaproteobacteria bacterium]